MKAVLDGEPPIELALRRSPRARRITLRVSRLDGRVTLTLPRGASPSDALAFAQGHEGWLRRNLARATPRIRPAAGASLPVDGRTLAIREGGVPCARIVGEWLLVPQGQPPGPALATLLKRVARERAQAAIARHAEAAGRSPGRLTLRDTRSRWGSCSARGDLMLSWRLIMAPPPVLNYVAAHEVAHLLHLDHSRAFWAATAALCPAWREPRDWLRRNGADLHRIDFDA